MQFRGLLDDLAEQFLRRAVDPMEILDQKRYLRAAAERFQHPQQEAAGAQANEHAVKPRERSGGRRQSEKIEQQAEVLRAVQLDRSEPGLELLRDHGFGLSRLDPERVPDNFDEGEK